MSNTWCVASVDSNVHVVWEDRRDGNPEIYYKRSLDNGTTWSQDIRLTNNSSNSQNLSIAVFGSYTHVVWEDHRHANNYGEIYYKRNPTGNTNIQIFSRNGLNKPISDNQNTYDTIIVTNDLLSDYLADVNLLIDTVIHTNDADLEMYLIHQGVTDTAVYQVGGNGDNFIGTILDDGASIPIINGTAPFTGSYKPVKPLSQFVNLEPAGVWILRIYDRAAGNTGTLKAWGLSVIISNTPIGIRNISNVIPEIYALFQNYPNPFNPTTKIKFDIPVSSMSFPNAPIGNPLLVLKVFDLLGREIATLVNEQLAPGTYEVTFDGNNYSSGIYFYQLKTNDFCETKKLILLK